MRGGGFEGMLITPALGRERLGVEGVLQGGGGRLGGADLGGCRFTSGIPRQLYSGCTG